MKEVSHRRDRIRDRGFRPVEKTSAELSPRTTRLGMRPKHEIELDFDR